MMADLANSQHL